jgi:peptide methionine sulfoxide reductase msrA/msrB
MVNEVKYIMNKKMIFLAPLVIFALSACSQQDMRYNKLTPEEERVILNKGTEMPWSGQYVHHTEDGTYTCKRCNAPLYRSGDKFDSHCGWPSFDDEVPGAVKRVPDADGYRTEIVCGSCGGHLGHVFEGEGFTEKNIRHCVNSVSLNFIPEGENGTGEKTLQKAYFAGGCFWGVEYYLEREKGVVSVTSGYMGGNKANPTYEEVCDKKTGHAETVEVVFDPAITSYETLARLFFEIHDPTQVNRQGPDAGEQYRSEVFYISDAQRETTEKLIGILRSNGYKVATRVTPASDFWPAETYHQDYYGRKGGIPYCHGYTKRF